MEEKNKTTVILVIAGVFLLIGLGVGGFFLFSKTKGTTDSEQSIQEKVIGDYQWDDVNLKTQYSNVLWNKIANHKLAGFSPKAGLAEKSIEGCGADYEKYLRVEGGMASVCFWLEKNNGEKINSLEKLVGNFAPVENEAEAVSFVAVTESDLKIDASGIPQGHVLTITDGFLVQLIKKHTYGCGNHKSTGVIYKITEDGNIQQRLVAFEKGNISGGPKTGICVD